MSKFSQYDEEIKTNCVNDENVYAVKDKMKKYIPSIENEDLEKFVIIKSKLLYVGINEKETEIANRLGIGGGEATSDAGATVQEVQAIVDGVVNVSEANKSKIPKNDTDKVGETEHTNDQDGLIGTRLFDRSGLNLAEGTWNILIEYDSGNREVERYGSGYYWLKKGQKYTIKGKEIDFKNDYVINYKDEEFTVLSGRAVNWNVNATLGVNENIALNLDPMSLANGTWEENSEKDEVNKENFYNFKVDKPDGSKVDTGIKKVGDVNYDDENKSLEFNRSNSNEAGEGGYIKLSKDKLDFSNGFTFEIYCNLDRLRYDNGSDWGSSLGLFCRISGLKADYISSMRFGWCRDNLVCRIGPAIEGKTLHGTNGCYVINGGFRAEDCGYGIGEDFYLTVTYTDNGISNYGTIKYYINGNKLLYDCEFSGSEYGAGLSSWNLDSCPFFLGVCPWDEDGNLYYLKGSVYSCRLYTLPLSPDEVKLNYDMTLKYRDSFKNEKILN